MRTVRLLALPVAVGVLALPSVGATAAHADPVGGAKLAGHGYVSSGARPPHIAASGYVIADADTGQVLAAKDPHGHYRPASTLKVLTSITLIPRLDPNAKIKPSLNAVNATGSAVGLDNHWHYTVNDLFHGLLMQSGNDAAIALAEANGGLKPTLAAMNAEAHRIQANDTIARTPNGLDDDPPLTVAQQHTSAYDLALMIKQGLKLPDFRRYVGSVLYDWPAPPTKKQRKKGKKVGGWQIGTHDHLLTGPRYRGMIGGKNGYTEHAQASFVGAATRGGHTILISLIHAQSDFWDDARGLLDWGFAHDGKVTPVGTLADPIPPPSPTPAPKALGRSAPHDTHQAAGGLPTWAYGAGGAALAAIVAGLVIGLAKRRRTAPATGPAWTPPALGPGDAPTWTPPAPDDLPTPVWPPRDTDSKPPSWTPRDTDPEGQPVQTPAWTPRDTDPEGQPIQTPAWAPRDTDPEGQPIQQWAPPREEPVASSVRSKQPPGDVKVAGKPLSTPGYEETVLDPTAEEPTDAPEEPTPDTDATAPQTEQPEAEESEDEPEADEPEADEPATEEPEAEEPEAEDRHERTVEFGVGKKPAGGE